MLENELRDMFSARVSRPLSALNPAGVAIQRGRRRAYSRRLVVGAISVLAFGAMLGGAALIKGLTQTFAVVDNTLTYEGLYGPGLEAPERGGMTLPVVTIPIDIYVGTKLWTAEGNQFTLSGVDYVLEVIRVPAGWLYSDDIRLRLLMNNGVSRPIRENISAWVVSPDGRNVATVTKGTILEVHRPGTDDVTQTVVPQGTVPLGFDGPRVVVSQQASNSELLAVYGAMVGGPVGLVRENGLLCLADLNQATGGWQLGGRLGCGDLLEAMAHTGYRRSEPARSPDGRMLAMPSATGVQVIDLQASRGVASAGRPVVAFTCPSTSDAPAIWSDATTLLTISEAGGIVACGTDGSRHSVPLPSGVSEGWALVPRYGMPD